VFFRVAQSLRTDLVGSFVAEKKLRVISSSPEEGGKKFWGKQVHPNEELLVFTALS